MQAATVGLLIGVSKDNQDAVILSVRASTKLEGGDLKPQSFPGACQVTAAGKLEAEELALGTEGFAAALLRETREELGNDIGDMVAEMVAAANSADFALLNEQINDDGRVIRVFGLKTTWDYDGFLSLVEKSDEVAGFRACTDPGLILALGKEHKKEGVPSTETRMFPDEQLAVRRFFDRFYWINNPAGPLEVPEAEGNQ